MAFPAIGRPLLFMVVLQLGLVSLSVVDARPCRTFLIAYSFSVTGHPHPHSHHQNPNRFALRDFMNPDLSASSSNHISSSSELVTIFTTTERQFDRKPSFVFFDRRVFPSREFEQTRREQQRPRLAPLSFFDPGSLRDRTVDILSVVIALLFGVGCGALTAATMYLAWSLFSGNRGDFEELESDDEDANPKKMGYVKIPAESFPAPTKA